MPATSPIDLSILVVSYETRELTLACLDSVLGTLGELAAEVLVADNASGDGSAAAIRERFPDLELVACDENLGFARANNLLAERASGRHLVLLNPDTVVKPGALAALVACADEHPEAGIVGGRTTFSDGTLNPSSCWARPTLWSTFCLGSGLTSLFRRSRLFDPESMGSWQRDSVRRVDLVSGCLLLIRRELWRELGGFDEEFFMYGEDADLCLRAEEAGSHCLVTPRAEIVHLGGASERVRSDKMVSLFRARARLYRKHWSPARARFGVAMLDLWAFTRMSALALVGSVRPGARASRRAWREVWSRRSEWKHDGLTNASGAA
jgi:GT2 family glycosyltransferase